MPRRGLWMFDRLWCSFQWEHCLSAGICNPQVTYDDEDGYADNGSDQIICDRRKRGAGLRQLQPSLCLSLSLQATMMIMVLMMIGELVESICNTSETSTDWRDWTSAMKSICRDNFGLKSGFGGVGIKSPNSQLPICRAGIQLNLPSGLRSDRKTDIRDRNIHKLIQMIQLTNVLCKKNVMLGNVQSAQGAARPPPSILSQTFRGVY